MKLIIRHERKKDFRVVEEVTREAFWNRYVPGCTEHFVLHNMRGHKDFIPELDFVAEKDGKVVGNIVFTRGKILKKSGRSTDVIGFGPVSVLPEYQGQGIGGSLINNAIEKARALGFKAVVIYGNPKYYSRFGFRCAEKYDITTAEGKFAVALLALELVPGALRRISGKFVESEAYHFDEAAFQKYDDSFPPKEKSVTESQKEFQIIAGLMY